MKLIPLLLIICTSLYMGEMYGGNTLDIGIMGFLEPTAVQAILQNGSYDIVADGKKVSSISARGRATFKRVGSLVQVSNGSDVIGSYKTVELKALTWDGVFHLYVLSPNKMERVYDDHLQLKVKNNALQLVNRVSLEKYVAGVVEAETGKGNSVEFYKVQAIISRTYALSNRRKHLHEGFNLNDQVDCQVYHGKSRWDPNIIKAVQETESLVLTNSEMKLVTAAFHSNSGGQTVNSEHVWSKSLPYLVGHYDEFSSGGEHANWNKMVSKEKWLSYLQDKYSLPTDDKLIRLMATNYDQEYRQVYFLDPAFNIPLKEVRKDWLLNSTLFDIEDRGDSLYFKGLGFGHGIGLSQEGAMRMADLGFNYTEILHYYYEDIHIIDLRALNFFLED